MGSDAVPMEPSVLVVMGVAGSGKTVVGRALAARLGWTFADADDFHTPEAVAKMRRGEGLTDADRDPWLGRLARLIASYVERRAPLILACSALKARYRARLGYGDPHIRFVWLDVPEAELARRLRARRGHYAGPALLGSQLRDLEAPEAACRVDATRPRDEVVAEVLQALRLVPSVRARG